MLNSFKAFRIGQTGESGSASVEGRFVSMDETALDAGDVLIRVECAAVNHKDALAASGRARIVRRLPCVGGIDLAGTVVQSAAPRFRPGDWVIATGYGLGVAHHGGYAEYALLPGGWLQPLPAGFSPQEAMAIGTAGFAAALAISRMESLGLKPETGPVIVSGASGGVGSLAIDMLAGKGYEVVALTGKPDRAEWLKSLGASRVMLREDLAPEVKRPLDKGWWAGAVDVLGGSVLAWMLATCKPGGVVASVGAVADPELTTSILPFVSRGVSLVGVDSVYAGFGVREKIWARLAGDLRPGHLAALMRTVAFDDLPNVFEDLIAALATGRTVVQIASSGNAKESS